ncbi:MAG: hypothetical protein V8S95_08070 [Odoribacter sp.]
MWGIHFVYDVRSYWESTTIVTGWVMDERGKPFGRASIRVKNTTSGTTTDKDGELFCSKGQREKHWLFRLWEERPSKYLHIPGCVWCFRWKIKNWRLLVQVAYGNLEQICPDRCSIMG